MEKSRNWSVTKESSFKTKNADLAYRRPKKAFIRDFSKITNIMGMVDSSTKMGLFWMETGTKENFWTSAKLINIL